MKYKTKYIQKLIGRAYDPSFFSQPIPEMLSEDDYLEIEHIHNEML